MDIGLLTLARAQGGVFAAGQARTYGLTTRDLTRLVGSGDAVRVRQGAYVLTEVWGEADAMARLILRTRAVMIGRPGAIAAGPSAVALHGLELWGVSMDKVTLHGDVNRVRTHTGLTLLPHLRLPEAQPPSDHVPTEAVLDERAGVVTSVDGVRAVSVAYAVVQLCVSSGHVVGLVTLDAALHRKVTTLDEVNSAVASGLVPATPRQAWHLQQLVKRADPKCESPGETRTRLLLQDLGYAPRSQVALSDVNGFVARVDFFVDNKIVVEFDGSVKYEGAEGRAALVAEKRREDRLRAMGLIVVRLVWSDLENPERVAEKMRQARAQIARQGAGRTAS
ncbi:type IV toxin-antitoxin system AbiEi family antitoxin domain-containing protein [Knoellia remsis]|uniref:type IV toxin-antitoxin system AbiEi family antitoxin domain-containing protein n=1 Tax=Knoellia remsis TaxID=407159 RepID=UPI0014763426|nr:type IV toxin-antitoxin system AbiEi family antitoxin domain-containing protein [Knoellia remsis]